MTVNTGHVTVRTIDAAALLRLRQAKYATRRAFCAAAGISVTYSKYLENGANQRPSPRIARDIAAALGCSVEDLYLPNDAGEEAA